MPLKELKSRRLPSFLTYRRHPPRPPLTFTFKLNAISALLSITALRQILRLLNSRRNSRPPKTSSFSSRQKKARKSFWNGCLSKLLPSLLEPLARLEIFRASLLVSVALKVLLLRDPHSCSTIPSCRSLYSLPRVQEGFRPIERDIDLEGDMRSHLPTSSTARTDATRGTRHSIRQLSRPPNQEASDPVRLTSSGLFHLFFPVLRFIDPISMDGVYISVCHCELLSSLL